MAGSVPSSAQAETLTPVWVPNPGPQTLLVSCPIWDVLYGGARGGGKTDGLLGDWTGFSLKYPGRGRGILFRRTYDELDEVVSRSHEILGPLGAEWRPSKYTWAMPWGGHLKLRYLKADADASRYQGHSYNWMAVDEAGNFASPDPIKKLTATLRDKTGVPVRKRLTANPGGPGHSWLKADYIDPALPGTPFQDPDTGKLRVFIPSKLQDNPALMDNDPDYLNRLRGSGPAWLVQAWLEGDWNAAPEGGVIKIEWMKRYNQVPGPPERYLTVHSWDTAYKPQQVHDPSVCTVWAVTIHGFYLLDVIRFRAEYPTLKKRVIDLAERDQPHHILIEDKASGQSLLQELRASTQLPVRGIEPEADKVTRALAVTGLMEAGKVFLPYKARWLLDYELELSMFPHKDMHDDQVDSTTQFLAWARLHAARRLEATSSGQQRAGLAETSFRAQDGEGWGSISSGANPEGFL